MKKEYKIKIKSIKTWDRWHGCDDYVNTAEALNYFVDVLASLKEFGLITKTCRKDKLNLRLYCDNKTYEALKMRFICDHGSKFEWID